MRHHPSRLRLLSARSKDGTTVVLMLSCCRRLFLSVSLWTGVRVLQQHHQPTKQVSYCMLYRHYTFSACVPRCSCDESMISSFSMCCILCFCTPAVSAFWGGGERRRHFRKFYTLRCYTCMLSWVVRVTFLYASPCVVSERADADKMTFVACNFVRNPPQNGCIPDQAPTLPPPSPLPRLFVISGEYLACLITSFQTGEIYEISHELLVLVDGEAWSDRNPERCRY